MERLPLKARHRPKVLDGTKRATVRRGRRNVLPGAHLPLTFGARHEPIPIVVERVCLVTAAGLTTADALREGHPSAASLRAALTAYYPDLGDDTLLTIIAWRLA